MISQLLRADCYRVSTSPEGARRWWVPGAVIPKDHTAIREATLDEEAMMHRIERAASPSQAMLRQLAEMMAAFDARNPGDDDA